MRTIHNFAQGSDAWHAHRRSHCNASEASAVLGLSPYQTRSELLREKAIGAESNISAETQALFDRGHAYEAMARPWAEAIIGDELYPIVASVDLDGLPLSASYDGVTMDETIVFEHKSPNEDLIDSLTRGVIPEHYKPQMEQQLLILGARRCLFVASSGDQEKMQSAWYESDPQLREKLLAAWRQFQEDLANYQHVEVLPGATGKAIMALPSLTVELVGEVKSSNLAVYRETALTFIRSINTELETDQDFADAEKMVKFCGAAEEELDTVKRLALQQTASIAELFNVIDALKEEMRAKRLTLTGLVKAKKETVRAKILQEGTDAFKLHLVGLNQRLGKPYMPMVPVDFVGVMRSKKTIASLRDAVATELARAKIAANDIADRLQINLTTLRETAAEFPFLFADTPTIILKANDDLTTLVQSRIREHKDKEEKRLTAEREKIRLEEVAKLEQKQREEAAKAAVAPTIPAVAPATPAVASPIFSSTAPRAATNGLPQKPARPSDEAIVAAVAQAFNVSVATALDWLRELQLTDRQAQAHAFSA